MDVPSWRFQLLLQRSQTAKPVGNATISRREIFLSFFFFFFLLLLSPAFIWSEGVQHSTPLPRSSVFLGTSSPYMGIRDSSGV